MDSQVASLHGLVELLCFVLLVVPVHEVGHEDDQLGSEGPKKHRGRGARNLRAGDLGLSLRPLSTCILVGHVSLYMVDAVSDLS